MKLKELSEKAVKGLQKKLKMRRKEKKEKIK
jgi:hypothetical protein